MSTITNATIEVQRAILTQTPGVAPIGVASTTVVADLNADLLDGQHAAAFAAVAHTHAFADLTAKPTTLAGYGIADAAADSHTHTFASLTSKPTTISGYGITDAYTEAEADAAFATIAHTHDIEDLTTGLGTEAQVWTKGAGGAMGWENATGGGGDTFATISDSTGADQFAASGADELQFAAGADLSVAFDAINKRVTFAYTGSGSGILRGYADITADSGASAAVGADTLIVTGAAGISTTSSSAPDTLTITLGNHSAALLTSGTVATARLGTGTADATTFLRGDGTWDVPAGGGSVDEAADYDWTGAHSFSDNIALGMAYADLEAWNTNRKVIESTGGAISFAAASNTVELWSNAYVDASNAKYKSTAAAARISLAAGAIALETAASGTADAVVSFGTRLNISVAGVVGIGTTNVLNASAGHLVMGNNKAIRAVNAAGDNSATMMRFDTSNRLVLDANSATLVLHDTLTQTTVGAAGGASALVATPTGYLRVLIANTERVIPFYAQA